MQAVWRGYAIYGTGIAGTDDKVVIMQNLSTGKTFVVNWRVQDRGSEMAAERAMVDEIIKLAGAQALSLVLMDGAYADGAWLA